MKILILLSLLLFSGCSTTNSGFKKPDLTKISVGMTKADVVAVLGKPDELDAVGGTENLFYGWDSPWDGVMGVAGWYYVRLENGLVVSFGVPDPSAAPTRVATRRAPASGGSSFVSGGSVSAGSSGALLLFGGQGHQVFLGCLNCPESSSSSIWNESGKYGNSYGDSIWNTYGQFGSDYSQFSPWNEYGQKPPIIVDKDGNSYGYFTVNEYFPKRTTDPDVLRLLRRRN